MIPRRFFWLLDLVVLGAAFLGAYALVPALQPFFAPGGPLRAPWLEALVRPVAEVNPLPPPGDLLWILLLMAPVTLVTLAVLGNQASLLAQSRSRIIIGSLLSPLTGLGLVALALFALKRPDWSRLFVFSFALLSGASLCLYRLLLRRYFTLRQAAGCYARNVLLVGLPSGVEWLAGHFARNVPATDYRLLGYLAVCPDAPPANPGCAGDAEGSENQVPSLGRVDQLRDLLIHRPIHEVIAIQPAANGAWIQQVIEDCDYFGILLRIVPEALLFTEARRLRTVYPFEPLHLPAVVLAPPHLDSDALFVKRLIDIAVSGTLLVLFAPIFLLIAIAIKVTTPHLPVFYRWRVVGQNGVEFTGFKFTTMVADADQRKAELLAHNEMNGPVFKMKDDPRVTPLGRFLRKFSLNELPQLWSVLKADMSLVGPRPAFRHELERYELWHKRKLCIRPGITCLWQVSGRNEINDFDDWVRLDLEYIDNWSLWLDLKILFRTAWVVVAGTGS